MQDCYYGQMNDVHQRTFLIRDGMGLLSRRKGISSCWMMLNRELSECGLEMEGIGMDRGRVRRFGFHSSRRCRTTSLVCFRLGLLEACSTNMARVAFGEGACFRADLRGRVVLFTDSSIRNVLPFAMARYLSLKESVAKQMGPLTATYIPYC